MVAEMLIRVGESGKSKGATVAWMSGIWNKGRATVTSVGAIRTKDSGYRCVNLSKKRLL